MDYSFSNHFADLDERAGREQFFIERLSDFWVNFPYKELSDHELLDLIDSVSYSLMIRKAEADNHVTNILEDALRRSFNVFQHAIPEMGRKRVTRSFTIMNALNLNFGNSITSALTDRSIMLMDTAPALLPKQALDIFVAGAGVGIPFSKDHLKRLHDYILDNAGHFDQKSASRCMRACAIYELRNRLKFETLSQTLQRSIAQHEFNAFSDIDKNQLYDSQTVMGLPVYFNRVSNPGASSALEKEFMESLEKAGAKSHPSARYVGSMFHDIDLAISWKKRLIMLEVDGPHHYIRTVKGGQLNITGYDGGTILQSALLRKSIPEDLIVRVSFHDLKEIVTSENEVRSFLDKCIVMPNGIYSTEKTHFGISINSILPETRAHVIKEFNPPMTLEEYIPI